MLIFATGRKFECSPRFLRSLFTLKLGPTTGMIVPEVSGRPDAYVRNISNLLIDFRIGQVPDDRQSRA
jgi:hypothetical protein